MSRLRRTVAKRLKEAQNTAAILTTFNEVYMSAVIDLRRRYRDAFEEKHGVRLGFMSFFVKAAVGALKEMPAVNGSIESKQHTVVVGHHAKIKATIFAKQIVVFGKVVGNVTATDKIDVREEGTVEGDLASPTVSIAEGAVFRGSIDMSRQSAESAAI